MSTWDCRMLRPGSWVIRRPDGTEVATIQLTGLPIETVVAAQVAQCIGGVVDRYEAEQQNQRIDWGRPRLGQPPRA